MNCPNCGVSLMGGMTVCPKCKWDNTQIDGGELFRKRKLEQENQSREEARIASLSPEEYENYLKEKEKTLYEELKRKYKPNARGAVFHIDGVRGRSIDIYPNKCVISVDTTLGALVTGNATDGEKTIYYGDCIGLQYKRAGVMLGYLQLETAAGTMNNSQSNFFNENTFTFDEVKISNAEMNVIVSYVKGQIEKVKIRMYGDGAD